MFLSTYWMGDWVYPEIGLDSLEKEKSLLPLPVAEPLILLCPPLNLVKVPTRGSWLFVDMVSQADRFWRNMIAHRTVAIHSSCLFRAPLFCFLWLVLSGNLERQTLKIMGELCVWPEEWLCQRHIRMFVRSVIRNRSHVCCAWCVMSCLIDMLVTVSKRYKVKHATYWFFLILTA